MNLARRRLALLALPIILLAGGPCLAADAAWVEPKFDPPVGSKWTVQRELNVEKNVAGTMIGHTLKQTALLTVEEKTANGYVMTYVRQSSDYQGDPAGASSQRIAYAAQQGVVMQVVTDASGKPLRIVNFAEVKAVLKQAIDAQPTVTAQFPRPSPRSSRSPPVWRRSSDKKAAELYLDDLPTLALAQNTGLKPGEMRKATLPVANALVAGITKVLTISIATDDPATGKVRYLMTETFDPDSMKALVGDMFKEIGATKVNATDVDRVMNAATVVAVARAQLDVEGGMTREMRRQSVTSFRAPGTIAVTSEDELVTISPVE